MADLLEACKSTWYENAASDLNRILLVSLIKCFHNQRYRTLWVHLSIGFSSKKMGLSIMLMFILCDGYNYSFDVHMMMDRSFSKEPEAIMFSVG